MAGWILDVLTDIHTSSQSIPLVLAMQTCLFLQEFLAFHQSLPKPTRLIGFSKFSSKHFASEGDLPPGPFRAEKLRSAQ